MTRVQGVRSKQGTDISELLNDYAGQYADSFTGLLIAESGLNEQALREGTWPDYSAGLSQVIAANLGYGDFKTRPDNTMLSLYRAFMFQPENAIRVGWQYYVAALARMDDDPLWAALSYNRGPNKTRAQLEAEIASNASIASRFERYRRSLQEAERYRITMPEAPTDDRLSVSAEMRAKLAEVDDYPILDSAFISIPSREEQAERVLGTKGMYVSSPVDGWLLHGPFPAAEA